MTKKKGISVEGLIEQIQVKLSRIEELAAWMVRADQRFRIGQRVVFSRIGIEQLGPGKGGVTKGKVLAFENDFIIKVLLDGYKQAQGYHHSFFNPVSGPKLF